jgi:hypothetical protein
MNAFPSVDLARDCLVDVLHADAFPGAKFVVNCEVKNQIGGVDQNGYHLHSDIWQERAGETEENVIIFGVKATETCQWQGLFSRADYTHRNIAFVNCHFISEGYPNQHQFITGFEHLVVFDNTFLGTPFSLVFSDSHPDVSGYYGSGAIFSGNLFQMVFFSDVLDALEGEWPAFENPIEGTMFRDNHYINLWPDYVGIGGVPYGGRMPGTGVTSGLSVPDGVGWREIWAPR